MLRCVVDGTKRLGGIFPDRGNFFVRWYTVFPKHSLVGMVLREHEGSGLRGRRVATSLCFGIPLVVLV